MRTIRQLLCMHWWGEAERSSYEDGRGAIICGEQKQYRITNEARTCRKCGLQDKIQVSSECLGWD